MTTDARQGWYRTGPLLVRLGLLYVSFAVLKRVLPLRSLARLAWSAPRHRHGRRPIDARAGLVKLQRVLGASRGDCLESSLVLYRELSRNGEAPVLVAGLTRRGDRTIGHAWVEVDGTPIMASGDVPQQFHRAVSFGPGGRTVPIARD